MLLCEWYVAKNERLLVCAHFFVVVSLCIFYGSLAVKAHEIVGETGLFLGPVTDKKTLPTDAQGGEVSKSMLLELSPHDYRTPLHLFKSL